jgi:hypothetical protein
MLRLIMKNGTGKWGEENLSDAGFRVFEIDCPELEKLVVKNREEEKPLTLIGIEVFIPPPKPVEPAKPPALPLAVLVEPEPPPNPAELKRSLWEKWRGGKKPEPAKVVPLPG